MIGLKTESIVENLKYKLHLIEWNGVDGMTEKMTKEIVERIFKEPGIKYNLPNLRTCENRFTIFSIFIQKPSKPAAMPARPNTI